MWPQKKKEEITFVFKQSSAMLANYFDQRYDNVKINATKRQINGSK